MWLTHHAMAASYAVACEGSSHWGVTIPAMKYTYAFYKAMQATLGGGPELTITIKWVRRLLHTLDTPCHGSLVCCCM